MLVAGVDEAGRGSIIGPLVVAGVAIREEKNNALIQIGVKDSKLLSPMKRIELSEKIKPLAEKYTVIKLTPAEIDKVVASQRKLHKLNRLEADTMAKIIDLLKPDQAYVDAADVMEDRFKHHIQEKLATKAQIVSRHKADRIYPVVSAASIIAKVERDNEIEALLTQYGDFGSGYLTDPKTMAFLKNWIAEHCDYPDCVRKSYKPAKRAIIERGTFQSSLFDPHQ
jgi:ribonuclease HII